MALLSLSLPSGGGNFSTSPNVIKSEMNSYLHNTYIYIEWEESFGGFLVGGAV